jgi:hypothetical protein
MRIKHVVRGLMPFCSRLMSTFVKSTLVKLSFKNSIRIKKAAFHADYEDDENVAIGSYKKETDQKNFVYNKTQKTV